MDKFNISEVNFICIFVGETKSKTIENIMDGIPHFQGENELVEIAEQSIIKLDTLTEAEFTEMNFKENFTE